MKLTRNTLLALLTVAGVLLILACTDFTAVTWPWRHAWRCAYFEYASQSGWGYQYVSDFSFAQALCYLAAYGVACVAFGVAARRHGLMLAGFALVLCLLGFLSFTIEITHWLWEHNTSWIASFPIVVIPLLVISGTQVALRTKQEVAISRSAA